MKKIRERFTSFTAAEPTEKRTIRGHEFRFYPLSAGMLFECRKAVPPILKALAVLFGDTSSDQTRHFEETTNPVLLDGVAGELPVETPAADGDEAVKAAEPKAYVPPPVFMQKRIRSDTTAADLAIVKYRDEQKLGAIQTLVDAIQDNETKRLLGRIILDSLREDYADLRGGGNKAKKDEAAIEFVDDEDNDLLVMKEFLWGVGAANRSLFGPLADQVTKAVKTAADRLLKEQPAKTEDKPASTDERKDG